MKNYNEKNERIKRDYCIYLKETDHKAESTLDGIRKALHRYEEFTGFADFKTFNSKQAIGFKKHLVKTRTARTREPLSKATIHSTVNILKEFFKWMRGEGFSKQIKLHDIGYLNLSAKDISIATSKKEPEYPSLEQIRTAVNAMPSSTELERRDRAVVAFTILTGVRDSALISLRLKHIDTVKGVVNQDPAEVNTKRSKKITTAFFPVGEDMREIVLDWIRYLKEEKHLSPNSPLFPKTLQRHDENNAFKPVGLSKEHWQNTTPVRLIFRQAFEGAGLAYFNPHSFRHTLVHLAERYCKTPEDFKAWSQNLGHEHVMTTFTSYGTVATHRQCELVQRLKLQDKQEDKLETIIKLLKEKEKDDA